MELLDSRCARCSKTDWQCTDCQKNDSRARRERKNAAKCAAQNIAPAQDLAHTVAAQLPAPALVKLAPAVAKTNYRSKLKANGWTIVRIPKDGHCLFESFARAFRICRPELNMTMKQLRLECSQKLRELNGEVPNWPMKLFDEEGTTGLEAIRGEPETRVNLDQYCQLVRTTLYGGTVEMMILAIMYKLKVTVHDQRFQEPQKFLQNCNLDADDPENEGAQCDLFCLPCCDNGIQVQTSTCSLKQEKMVELTTIRSYCATMQNTKSLCCACPYGIETFVLLTVAKKVADSRRKKLFTRAMS